MLLLLDSWSEIYHFYLLTFPLSLSHIHFFTFTFLPLIQLSTSCQWHFLSFQERLTSPESIAEQMAILISQVCPQAADAAVCEEVCAKKSLWDSFFKSVFTYNSISHFLLCRVLPCGGLTWQCASTPLSSEEVILAQSSASARWRACSGTGPAMTAPTSWPASPSSWRRKRPSPRVLLSFR